ncbi:helix-turn-helix domain-containing protein [Acetobacter sicerae]|uniref:Helix-turn-helix domain-containing protein n=1 Tax=Acetobacter sicerae TaxID=85325 RepID=A0ABS8W2U7_9PROT|nr:helix-turn-helix transcriptional regulator [Acetobacter sicerae]MCE0745566.1 helix-turn-helix domain-containing protein [Acetobacter sicerae]
MNKSERSGTVAAEAGRWLRQFRVDAGLTGTSAGKMMHTSSSRIGQIENGHSMPTTRVILDLLWIYDVSEGDAVAFFAALLKEDSRSRLSHPA